VAERDETLTPQEMLTRLQVKCSRALDTYMHVVKQGCELLMGIKDIPAPENERNEILSHRRRELQAHADYTKARSKLWEFLNRI